MYSEEINELMIKRNYKLTPEEYCKLDPLLSPQITHIHYDAYSNRFQMHTNDGYDWDFEIINEGE